MVNIEEGAKGGIITEEQRQKMLEEAQGIQDFEGKYLIDRSKFKVDAGSYKNCLEIWEYHKTLNKERRLEREKKAGVMAEQERHFFLHGLWNAIFDRVKRVRPNDSQFWLEVRTTIPENPVVDLLRNPFGTVLAAGTKWFTETVVVPSTTGIVKGMLQGLGVNTSNMDWKKIGIVIAVAAVGILGIYIVIKVGSKRLKR